MKPKSFWSPTLEHAVRLSIATNLYHDVYHITGMHFRVNGHKKDSLHTYGMISGLTNCGVSLGSTVGPPLTGLITDKFGFQWAATYIPMCYLFMVSRL